MTDKNKKILETVLVKISELDQAIANAGAVITDESSEDFAEECEDRKIWDKITGFWFVTDDITTNVLRFIEKYK